MQRILQLLALALALPAAAAPRVPGFDRPRGVPGDEPAAAGRVLLSELSCLACHGPAVAADWKAGPDLSDAAARLRPAWVRDFLRNPAATAPGTTMPDLLAGLPDDSREGMIEDVVHFLFRKPRPGFLASAAPAPEAIARGAAGYRDFGCLACHGEAPPAGLAAKYSPGALVEFLRDPLRARPSGRMPSSRLTPVEAGDLAAYLAPGPGSPENRFTPDPARVARGEKAFLTLGCASCHGGGAAIAARPLRELRSDDGCLAEQPKGRAPRYGLSPEQRLALRAALGAAPSAEDQAGMAVRHAVRQFDCLACHSRGGLGGPAAEVAAHFRSTRDDLGDLGRLPPPLDGVGRKLLPEVLPRVLRGQERARTYMITRMPDFGAAAADHLAGLLARADAEPREQPVPATLSPNLVGRNEWGRELVGTGGYACIACHEMQGHPSLGIGAYDLAHMPRRLRPEWMREFLLNPAAFPTGTRMPAFWPGGKPALPKRAGNDAERQIDSIRVYLTEADQSLPPEGLADPAAFELKPVDRPLVFRTFIEGVGMHAIAVGFPGGINLAFDAKTARWTRAWRGRFLDAAGTWHLRVGKLEKPLGEPVALPDLPLPSAPGLTATYRGYRIDAAGVPTFLYSLGTWQVEDRVEPVAPSSLRRTLRLRGGSGPVPKLPLRAGPVALTLRRGVAEWKGELPW